MTKRYLMDNGLLAVPLTKNWDFDEDMQKLNEIFNLKQKLGNIYYSKECQRRVWKEREREREREREKGRERVKNILNGNYNQNRIGLLKCLTKKIVDKSPYVDQDETLISFDVSPLNTNVPVKEAIKKAIDELYSENV